MDTESEKTVVYIGECIEKLQSGTATNEEVAVVKEYIRVAEEALNLFDESIKEVLTEEH